MGKKFTLRGGINMLKMKFIVLEDGKITFTQEEFQKLVDEIYNEGVAEGKKDNITITTQPNTTPWTNPAPSPWYYNVGPSTSPSGTDYTCTSVFSSDLS